MANKPHNSQKKVAVIGGGITGLCACFALIKDGAKVTLFEPNTPGGLIKSSLINGFQLEHGATTLAFNKAVMSLLDHLELSKKITTPRIKKYSQFVWYNGKITVVPRGPLKLIKSALLSTPEKFNLIKGLFKAPDTEQLNKAKSIHDLVSLMFGEAVAERIAAPVIRGIFGGDTKELLAELTLTKLTRGLKNGRAPLKAIKETNPDGRPPIGLLKGGNDQLCKKLLEVIQNDLNLIREPVKSLNYDQINKSFSVETDKGKKDNEPELIFDNVVIATSGPSTASFINTLDRETAALLYSIKYAEILVVHCSVTKDNKIPVDGFGVLFPKGAREDLLGILYNSKLFPHVAPANRDLVTLCFGGTEGLLHQAEKYPPLIQKILSELYKVKEIEILNTTHWPHAIPQYDSTVLELRKTFLRLESKYPGLIFCGSEVGGVGVPYRIEQGLSVPLRLS